MIKEIANVSKEEILRNLPAKEKPKEQFYYCPKKRFFQREVLDSQCYVMKYSAREKQLKKGIIGYT